MHCVSMSIATIVKRRDLDALCVLRSDSSIIGNSSIDNVYKLLTAQIPNAIVRATPPKLKMRMGASPPSRVVPTRSPTFLA